MSLITWSELHIGSNECILLVWCMFWFFWIFKLLLSGFTFITHWSYLIHVHVGTFHIVGFYFKYVKESKKWITCIFNDLVNFIIFMMKNIVFNLWSLTFSALLIMLKFHERLLPTLKNFMCEGVCVKKYDPKHQFFGDFVIFTIYY